MGPNYGQNAQFPFLYPGVYSPGQMAFNNNPELSQLVSMFSGPLLGAFAGPGNFVPHMMPTQAMADQFALRNYQNQTRTAAFNIANDNTDAVAKRLLGIRSAFTGEAATELNREQAANMASIVNNPFVKGALGMMIGPENMESILHGSKGDVSALQNTISRIGYFRKDPSGYGRMDSDSLEDYSRGLYAHMYEPQGDLEEIEAEARDEKEESIRQRGRTRLKRAAKQEDVNIVEDADVLSRLETMENAPEKIDALYKKYVAGGKATETKQQAQELLKFDRAIQESGQLKENETTIGQLVKRAERVPVNEMHGFMAGQVGQIAENMFQRGLMPQAVGAMSAADRVRMINQTPLDEETKDRLSREMAKRDLENTNNASDTARQYRALTSDPERARFIEQEKGTYRTQLEETRKKIEAVATGADKTTSAADLEKLQGFDSLSGNVDAKRSAEAIKKYTGAVAAIRDIFGDNGNPNAPLPALLAALEGLTGGAIGSMKPQKIEATLRQMQTLAKEAGIGFEQMAAMSTQIDSMGQALGLTPADTLRTKASTMAAVKVMQDTGAFSNPVYGQVDKGRATATVAELMTRGAASPNSKAMASLESIYQSDPEKFKNTELEKALEAYRNNEGDGTYTYEDPNTKQMVTRNLREDIGRFGIGGATRILTESGGTLGEFNSQFHNPAVMQFANKEFGFLTQKEDIIKHLAYGTTQNQVMQKLGDSGVLAGMDYESKSQASAEIAMELDRMILDTSDKELGDQITYIQDNAEERFKKLFSKTMPPAEAEAKAKEAAASLGDRRTLNAIIGEANTVHYARTGRMLSQETQFRGGARDTQIAAEAATSQKRAERRTAVGLGFEGTPAGRISDYLLDIGESGEKFQFDNFVKAMAPVISDREVLNRYAHDMEGGFKTLTEMRRDALITNAEVKDMADKNNVEGLRALAGVSDKVQIVDNAQAEKLRDEKIAVTTKDNKSLLAAYRRYSSGGKNLEADKLTEADRTNIMQELRSNERFMADMTRDALGENQITRGDLEKRAYAQVGSAEKNKEQLAEDLNKVQKAMFGGRNEDNLREGVYATFRAVGASVTDEQAKAIHDAVRDTSPEGKKKLEALLADKNLAVSDETRNKMSSLLTSMQTGKEADIVGTLGITELSDQELKKQITQQFESQGMTQAQAEQKAQEVQADVAKQKEQATEAGKKPDSAAAKQQLEASLQKHYEAQQMAPEEAKKRAQEDASTIIAKAAAEKSTAASSAAAGTAGVAQRVDTLEVNAQTVVIKSGKIESAPSSATPGSSTTGAPTPPAVKGQELPTNSADVNKEMDAIVQRMKSPNAVARFFGDNKLKFASKEDEERYNALNKRKQELAAAEGKTPDSAPKADGSVKESVPAPKVPAAEPDKVQQANGEQLKRDTGNTTAAPAPAPAQAQEATIVDQKQREAFMAAKEARAKNNKLYSNLSDKDKMATERAVDHYGELISLGGTDFDKYKEEIKNYTGNNNDFSEEARAAALAEIDMRQKEHENKQARDGDKQYQADVKQYGAAEAQKMYNKRVSEAPTGKEVADAKEAAVKQETAKPEQPAATSTPKEKSSVPASMTALIDAAKASPVGQAVLQGATALYEKFAPEAVKDAVANQKVSDTPTNERQQELQELYVHKQKRALETKEKTDYYSDADREYAEKDAQATLTQLGIHNAARAAGIDTTSKADVDWHAGTINGQKVGRDEIDRHVRLVKERAEKDPYSVVDESIRKRLNLPSAVTQRNEEELKKTAGISSANVKPEDAAKAKPLTKAGSDLGSRLLGGAPTTTIDINAPTPPQGSSFNPAADSGFDPQGRAERERRAGPVAGGDIAPVMDPAAAASAEQNKPLADAISEVRPQAGGGVSAASRVQALPANLPVGSAPAGNVNGSQQNGMTINGTLTLSGLQEAILSAQGSQIMQTEAGAPVVIDPAMQQRAPAAPKIYG